MDRGVKLQVSSGIGEDSGYTCASWHPDGLIFATGTTDGKVSQYSFPNEMTLTTDNIVYTLTLVCNQIIC